MNGDATHSSAESRARRTPSRRGRGGPESPRRQDRRPLFVRRTCTAGPLAGTYAGEGARLGGGPQPTRRRYNCGIHDLTPGAAANRCRPDWLSSSKRISTSPSPTCAGRPSTSERRRLVAGEDRADLFSEKPNKPKRRCASRHSRSTRRLDRDKKIVDNLCGASAGHAPGSHRLSPRYRPGSWPPPHLRSSVRLPCMGPGRRGGLPWQAAPAGLCGFEMVRIAVGDDAAPSGICEV